MNELFWPYLRHLILVFFDDSLVYSKNWDDHQRHLHTIFSILETNHLFAKESNCTFGIMSVEYLGYIVSMEGVSANLSKLQAIQDWLVSTTIQEVRGFLGLAGYNPKFVPHFREIMALLTQVLTKTRFH